MNIDRRGAVPAAVLLTVLASGCNSHFGGAGSTSSTPGGTSSSSSFSSSATRSTPTSSSADSSTSSAMPTSTAPTSTAPTSTAPASSATSAAASSKVPAGSSATKIAGILGCGNLRTAGLIPLPGMTSGAVCSFNGRTIAISVFNTPANLKSFLAMQPGTYTMYVVSGDTWTVSLDEPNRDNGQSVVQQVQAKIGGTISSGKYGI